MTDRSLHESNNKIARRSISRYFVPSKKIQAGPTNLSIDRFINPIINLHISYM